MIQRSLKAYIRWCTRAQRTLLVLAITLSAAFYFFAYRPSTERLARLRRETQATLLEVRANEARSTVKTEIAARNVRLRLELDRIKRPARQQDIPLLIKNLSLFAQQSSLKKFSYEPTSPQNARNDGKLFEIPIGLQFEGDFLDVFAFLRNAEDMQQLTRIRNVTLKTKDSASGQVSAQVSLSTYFSAD